MFNSTYLQATSLGRVALDGVWRGSASFSEHLTLDIRSQYCEQESADRIIHLRRPGQLTLDSCAVGSIEIHTIY